MIRLEIPTREVIMEFVVIIALIALYFLPTIIACKQEHKNIPAIAALNILLGWTILGWVGALVWALSK